jgi:hypothetical protein
MHTDSRARTATDTEQMAWWVTWAALMSGDSQMSAEEARRRWRALLLLATVMLTAIMAIVLMQVATRK